jgi:2-methylcitrate dehydratase PrpD
MMQCVPRTCCYPSSQHNDHPGDEHKLTSDQIEKVTLRVNPLVIKLTGKKTPQTGLEAKFSIFYISAASIIEGVAGPNQFTDEAVRDPETVALRDRVEATIDENVSEEEVLFRLRSRMARCSTNT